MLSTFCKKFSSNMFESPQKNKILSLKNNPFKSFIISQKAQCITKYFVSALLIKILLFLFLFGGSPILLPLPPPLITTTSPLELQFQSCKYGKVFVYDLPPMFNKELLDNCDKLNPWISRCDAVSNGGFGPKATGLEVVMPENLTTTWYWTDMYNGEVIYHMRMLNYKCRTMDPLEAKAFYIPFYASLSFGKYVESNYSERDRHSETVLNWLKDQPSWKRGDGSDHFIMLGSIPWDFRRRNEDSAWGTSFVFMPLMKNVFRVSIEKLHWDKLEVSVPYPTAFHPRTETDVLEWQDYVRGQKRKSLFSFVGAERKKVKNDFRGLLMKQCKSEIGSCRILDCAKTPCYDGAPQILEALLDSDFCLQPRGEGLTRRAFFDCMLAGSIPVYFWKESFEGQYEWHLESKNGNFSVFIDHEEFRKGEISIRKVLEGFSKEEVRRMRERVIEMIPRFLYAFPSEGLGNTKDAFDITVEGVLKKLQRNGSTIP